MKRIKLIVILVIVVFTAINTSAQKLPDLIGKTITPVSPTAFQFLKFGEIPVSEYTGSPSIEIPLFNVDIKGYTLPIKLQYHSKGIRVSEEADWVGLGWDLSFGSVTQMVNDKNDLNSGFYYKKNIPFVNSQTPSNLGYLSNLTPDFTDMFINDASDTYDGDKTYSFITYQKGSGGSNSDGWDSSTIIDFNDPDNNDYEKDNFVANVLGEQLNIIMKISPTDTSYVVLNKKGYKVSYQKGYWKICSPSGITCLYEVLNTCTTSIGTSQNYYNSIFSDNNTLLGQATSLTSTGYYTGSYAPDSYIWQISKIISIYGDTIKFNYESKRQLKSSNTSAQWKVGTCYQTRYPNYDTQSGYGDVNGCIGPYTTPPYYIIPASTSQSPVDAVILTTMTYTQDRSYLSSITYKGNTISFYTSARSDWANSKQLDSITVTNSDLQKIKSIKLYSHYYLSNYSGRGFKEINNYTNMTDSRLRLDSLFTQKGEKYSLTYNTTPLPSKISFGIDYWGYYNGQINNKSILANVADFAPNSGYITSCGSTLSKNSPTGRYAVSEFCKAGILEKIQYPTGGCSRFYYSLNCFDNYQVPNNPATNTPNVYYGNGLRIDSILNYTDNNTLSMVKYYKYERGKLQTPLHLFFDKPESYISLESLSPNGVYLVYRYSGTILNICSNNYYIPNPLGDGSGVGYDRVSSWVVNVNTKQVENGKTVHTYVNNPDVVSALSCGSLIETVPLYHKGFGNGSLLREELLDNANKKISATQYDYKLAYDKPIDYNSRATYLGQWGIQIGYKAVLIGYYPLYKPETLLKSKKKVDYINTDSIVNSETYFYNENNLINYKGMFCTSNTWQASEERYYYPTDIVSNSQFTTSQIATKQSMLNYNRLNEQVKSEQSIRSLGQLTTKSQYVEYDNSLLPSAIKSTFGSSSSSLNTDVTYKYNSYKSIVEKQENGCLPTTYLWGYKNQYIVAKIEGLAYTDVANALTQSFIDNLSVSASPTSAQLNTIRTSLTATPVLNLALVTTYTYKPLVGMLTATDPHGVTTTYEYDPLNRLQMIKDAAGNILQKFDYNYQH